MPLHDVLSAVRHLILDERNLPLSEDERRSLYQNKFPGLTLEELEDLAKIKPSQLHTYTVSIFSAQHKLLRSKFPITFALFEAEWPSVYKQKFKGFEFVRGMHEQMPWRGNETLGLIDNFCNFVASCLTDITKRVPFICDLLCYERTTVDLFRDSTQKAQKATLSKADLTTLTVNELLDLGIEICKPIKCCRFQFSIPDYVRQYLESEKRLGSDPLPNAVAAVASRNQFLEVKWSVVPETCLRVIEMIEQGKSIMMHHLGVAFMEDKLGRTEVEEFSQFINMVAILMENGAITIPVVRSSVPFYDYSRRNAPD